MSTPQQRLQMAKEIMDLEARRDANGHLKVYTLPANDGGGRYEVAGINEKYNPEALKELVSMLNAKQYDRAEAYAQEFIAKDTDSAAKLTKIPAIESYLRDCVFNRGATGMVRICQRAVEAGVDGQVGPETLAKIAEAEKDPEEFLKTLRVAREWYERSPYVGYRANLWAGLVNRWNNALTVARKFPMTPPAVAPVEKSSWLATLLDAIVRVLSAFFSRKPAEKPTQPQGGGPGPTWMPVAEKEVGFHEVGVNLGTEKYIDGSKNGPRSLLLGEPWCADYSNYCLETVGIRGTRSAMARSYEESPYFVKLAGPAYGAITTMWRGSFNSGLGHVFFYLGENDKGVYGLGGNQSDSVSKEYHPRNRIVGYYWPKAQPLPVTGAVTIAADGKKGSEE